MDVIYGCDCKLCNHHDHDDGESAPVAFLVEREGRTMKVCTQCWFRDDKIITRLFDRDTKLMPFLRYDALGAMMLTELLDTEEEESYAS